MFSILLCTLIVSQVQNPSPTPYSLIDLCEFLINGPVGDSTYTPENDYWESIQSAIRHVAIGKELMDGRECAYLFVRISDFQNDLDTIRTRSETFKFVPTLSNTKSIPSYEDAQRALEENRQFEKTIEQYKSYEFDRVYLYDQILRENKKLYKIWSAIHEINTKNYYTTTRRRAIKTLIDEIEEEAFMNCNFPPAIPTWRIQK